MERKSFFSNKIFRVIGIIVLMIPMLASSPGVPIQNEMASESVIVSADENNVGFYVPSQLKWYLKNDKANGWGDFTAFNFGAPSGAQPVAGDWDNDGVDTVGFYVPSQGKWYLKNNQTSGWTDFVSFRFAGPSGSLAVAGDWDNDGVDTIGFYVPSQGKWYLKNNQINGWNDYTAFNFAGPSGSLPVAGDWNDNGTDTVGFYVPSQGKWYLKNTQVSGWTSYIAFNFAGPSGAQPVAGDWDGFGSDTVGFYVPSQLKWYLKNNLTSGWTSYVAFKFGGPSGSLAVAGDWSSGQTPTCYTLTRNYVGSGSAPTASPTNSTGCPTGQYTAGQGIVMTPHPASGWSLDYWVGTTWSYAAFLDMPSSAHVVTAYYKAGPSTLRVINDLYDQEVGVYPDTWDWEKYNSILWVKVAPTCENIYNDGTELLWPSDIAFNAEDLERIAPNYLQTTSYEDFDVSFLGGEYCLFIMTGWWDSIFSTVPPYNFMNYEKTPTNVMCCDNVNLCWKWTTIWVSPPYGNPEVITASDWLPHASWAGTDFCSSSGPCRDSPILESLNSSGIIE